MMMLINIGRNTYLKSITNNYFMTILRSGVYHARCFVLQKHAAVPNCLGWLSGNVPLRVSVITPHFREHFTSYWFLCWKNTKSITSLYFEISPPSPPHKPSVSEWLHLQMLKSHFVEQDLYCSENCRHCKIRICAGWKLILLFVVFWVMTPCLFIFVMVVQTLRRNVLRSLRRRIYSSCRIFCRLVFFPPLVGPANERYK
jgi:hypothetical protein